MTGPRVVILSSAIALMTGWGMGNIMSATAGSEPPDCKKAILFAEDHLKTSAEWALQIANFLEADVNKNVAVMDESLAKLPAIQKRSDEAIRGFTKHSKKCN